jgi:hypothetical protein
MGREYRQVARLTLFAVSLVAVSLVANDWPAGTRVVAAEAGEVPTFQYDPSWPKPLQNHWLLGQIAGMTLDPQGHIWVEQRPATLTSLGEMHGLNGESECCFPAPPILEFDTQGKLLSYWGPIHTREGGSTSGKAKLIGPQVWGPHPEIPWPGSEHGIFVDDKYVYISGNFDPSIVLKFTKDGKTLVRQFGGEEAKSINDTENFAGPTQMVVDPKTNEMYVADGYRNRRVIVLDADTGAYKRHWGAYGHKPPDGPQGGNPIEGAYRPGLKSQDFAMVHCLIQSKDDLIYVCDGRNDRIQVFKRDGTFVKEQWVGANATGTPGSAVAMATSPDQRFLYLADAANHKIWIIRRDDLNVLGSFPNSAGRNGGQVMLPHALAVDAKGNIYVGETTDNDRVQRFNFVGMQRLKP